MTKKRKNSARSVATIISEIRGTYRTDIATVIKRGKLLQEAKDQLEHGQWLPWLWENFSMHERTAQRAMNVAKLADKYDRLSDLRITKEAIYDLASGMYPAKVIKAALKEAKTKLVNIHRLARIYDELNPPPKIIEYITPKARLEAAAQAQEQAEAEADAEADAILDGPPPDLPPAAPPPAPVDFVLTQFNNAIKALSELQTKSVIRFTGTGYTADDLRKVADLAGCDRQRRRQ